MSPPCPSHRRVDSSLTFRRATQTSFHVSFSPHQKGEHILTSLPSRAAHLLVRDRDDLSSSPEPVAEPKKRKSRRRVKGKGKELLLDDYTTSSEEDGENPQRGRKERSPSFVVSDENPESSGSGSDYVAPTPSKTPKKKKAKGKATDSAPKGKGKGKERAEATSTPSQPAPRQGKGKGKGKKPVKSKATVSSSEDEQGGDLMSEDEV